MGGTSSPCQIETMGFSHHFVALLTHTVSRHVMHSTKLTLAKSPYVCYHARVCVHGCVLR